jgi:predicted ester cyclase
MLSPTGEAICQRSILIMSNADVVRQFLDGEIDLDRAADYLAENFEWSDSIGSPPADKAGYLGLGAMMQAALPDLEFVLEDLQEVGDTVVVAGYFKGTFMNDFDLSAMGMGVIPATGARVRLPSNRSQWGVEGDKIVSIHDLDTGPDAGMAGFVKALSVDMG